MKKLLLTAAFATSLIMTTAGAAFAMSGWLPPAGSQEYGQHIANMAKVCDKAMFGECISEMSTPLRKGLLVKSKDEAANSGLIFFCGGAWESNPPTGVNPPTGFEDQLEPPGPIHLHNAAARSRIRSSSLQSLNSALIVAKKAFVCHWAVQAPGRLPQHAGISLASRNADRVKVV